MVRGAQAATLAIRRAGGVFLAEDAAKGLAEAALVAAEPWLRALTLREAAEAMLAEAKDPAVRRLAAVWQQQAKEYLRELEKKNG